jgi:hypothetical protein
MLLLLCKYVKSESDIRIKAYSLFVELVTLPTCANNEYSSLKFTTAMLPKGAEYVNSKDVSGCHYRNSFSSRLFSGVVIIKKR